MKLDVALKNNEFREAMDILKSGDSVALTDNTLNCAILYGYHPVVTKVLELGAKPNADTVTCLLFSGQPHYIATRIINDGADIGSAKEHVEHSNMHHPVRSRIKGDSVKNRAVTAKSALEYATENLSSLNDKYGPFYGLKQEQEQEQRRGLKQEQEQRQEQEQEQGLSKRRP